MQNLLKIVFSNESYTVKTDLKVLNVFNLNRPSDLSREFGSSKRSSSKEFSKEALSRTR